MTATKDLSKTAKLQSSGHVVITSANELENHGLKSRLRKKWLVIKQSSFSTAAYLSGKMKVYIS